ncbi:MAG TPA: DUF3060 domain-containing protein [Sphingopyxis sp.]|uniref:DUF3060 domain-containing protein n=1 Tax=Sphingopyxis sp. TaxID=1908224 RepID=UPI002B80AE0A|nr:DUF3060 domain-containing protein [Sphingopyxis sp.]HWW58235.1 DUF3060 domain-containing protein [Sphingopyxis sp.]
MFHTRAAAKSLFPALAASLVLAAAPLAAQQRGGTGTRDGAAVHGVEQVHRIDCGGRPAEVSGSDNRIDFVGDCPGLTVNGVDNEISIVLRPGAPLSVSGVDNVVTWRVNGKGKPRVSVQGVDNRVRPSS